MVESIENRFTTERITVIINRTDRLGDRLSCMQIFMFLFGGFWEPSVGRGVADSVYMIWGLEKVIQRTDPKPWNFEGKIFRLRGVRSTSLVKFCWYSRYGFRINFVDLLYSLPVLFLTIELKLSGFRCWSKGKIDDLSPNASGHHQCGARASLLKTDCGLYWRGAALQKLV